MTAYEVLVAAAGIAAGALASVVGFGIGSLLTPVLAISAGTKTAVAAVSIPHVIGTLIRFVQIRGHVDWHVFLTFGLLSAAGGLAGALLHTRAGGDALAIVFGVLLILVSISEFTGFSKRIRFEGPPAWIAGVVSGMLGGLVGNQGGIRSGALMGFHLKRDAFVATATAIGLVVDAARMPVYLVTDRDAVAAIWPVVALATAGVIVGTLAGRRLLARVPEAWFHKLVAAVLFVLGTIMLARAIA
jgi:uncharacterized membrane protein YfcA